MLQRLGSRKFLITVSTLLTALFGTDVDPVRLAIIGLVAGIYVLVEGLIDKSRAETFGEAIEAGLAIGREGFFPQKSSDEQFGSKPKGADAS